jgi:hypothetical protein
MSRFNSLLENQLNTTDLLRIRVKFDPANNTDSRSEYVGYVLQEDGTGGVVAIVPDMGSTSMSLTPDQFELAPIEDVDDMTDTSLTPFKRHVVKYLMQRGYHDKVTDHIETIINASDPTELEAILTSCGCNDGMLIDMYRDFASNE